MPYFPNHAVLGKRHQQSCSSVCTRDVVCIDQYGKGFRQFYLLIKNYIAPIKGLAYSWVSAHYMFNA